MKKQVKKQKTLALNKVQIMKMSEIKSINGGEVNRLIDLDQNTSYIGDRTLR